MGGDRQYGMGWDRHSGTHTHTQVKERDAYTHTHPTHYYIYVLSCAAPSSYSRIYGTLPSADPPKAARACVHRAPTLLPTLDAEPESEVDEGPEEEEEDLSLPDPAEMRFEASTPCCGRVGGVGGTWTGWWGRRNMHVIVCRRVVGWVKEHACHSMS